MFKFKTISKIIEHDHNEKHIELYLHINYISYKKLSFRLEIIALEEI